MSLEVEILQLAQNQIEDNTRIRSCLIGEKIFDQYPFANIALEGGGNGGLSVWGSLDENWFLMIRITARSIQDYYDVANILKTLWSTTGAGTPFQAMRDLGTPATYNLLSIEFQPPVGMPWQVPLNENDNVLAGTVNMKLLVRHSY